MPSHPWRIVRLEITVPVGWALNTNNYGPKYSGILGVNARGSWNQTAWSLQRAIYYTMKQDFETVLYKPCATVDSRSRAPCTVVYRVKRGCWPSLCHCSPPSLDPVCSTLCLNCHNCLLARQPAPPNLIGICYFFRFPAFTQKREDLYRRNFLLCQQYTLRLFYLLFYILFFSIFLCSIMPSSSSGIPLSYWPKVFSNLTHISAKCECL